MAFEFECPQGHVLEGDEADIGQMSQCPICGDSFLIPSPLANPESEFVEPRVQDYRPQQEETPAAPDFSIVVDGSAPPDVEAPPAETGENDPAPEMETELLHIDCPNGHELEVPRDMLNQDAKCPHCDVQFRLREVDSKEHQQKKKVEEEVRERNLARAWLNWTIALSIFVVLLLLTLWILTLLKREPEPTSGLTVTEDFLSSIFTAGTHHSTPGMTGSTTQVKAIYGRTMVGPTRCRTHKVELIEIHRALHDVPACQTESAFQIKWA